MGLLDDAIREHLELKRSRGADPDELARVEHEALEAGVPDEFAGADVEHVPAGAEHEPAAPVEPAPAAENEPAAAAEPEPLGEERMRDFSSVGQETAEIDMSAVLAENDGSGIDERPGEDP